jgi:2-haloacid dehalogenase
MGPVALRSGVRRTSRESVRYVLFDIGGVLVRWDDEVAFRRIARRYHLDLRPTSALLRALRPGLQSGRLTLHEFWSRFARTAHVPVPEDWRTLWVAELERGARPRRAVQGLAADLRRAGVRTGVFSNTDASHWRHFRSSGWLDGFSPAIPSFQIRAVKPDLLAFRRASGRLPAGARRPVFVDDNPTNVAMGRSVGWDSLRFTSVPQLRRELAERGLLDRA